MGLERGQKGSPRRPRWLPAIATVVGVCLTASAGNWQLDRAHEKERLQRDYERGEADAPILLTSQPASAEDLRLRRVEVTGEFDTKGLVLLDNRMHNGQAGYEVVMPVRMANTAMHVLVDRGWIASGPDRSRLPKVRTPAGTVKIVGMATVPGRFFELSKSEAGGPVWQNLTIDRYMARTGLQVQPVVVQQQNDVDDGLQRFRGQPDFGIAKHYGYAVQWFLFCGLMIFLYAYFHVKSIRSKKDQADAPVAGRD
ncbi:MAG TPA: SURF1 family protein [Burkholderiales bacterium]|nr:SURF1 family protein [Burkholderiales bacterium]